MRFGILSLLIAVRNLKETCFLSLSLSLSGTVRYVNDRPITLHIPGKIYSTRSDKIFINLTQK